MFLPYDDHDSISNLAEQCAKLSRKVVLDFYDPPTDGLVAVKFFQGVFSFLTGRKAAWGMVL